VTGVNVAVQRDRWRVCAPPAGGGAVGVGAVRPQRAVGGGERAAGRGGRNQGAVPGGERQGGLRRQRVRTYGEGVRHCHFLSDCYSARFQNSSSRIYYLGIVGR
jgi:hypothetical protein